MPGDDDTQVRLGKGTLNQDLSARRLQVGEGGETVDLSPPLSRQRRGGGSDEVSLDGKHGADRRAPAHPAGDLFCGTTDPADAVGLRIRTYGAPAGRWPTTALTYSVDPTDGTLGNAAVPIIANAFTAWQNASGFRFTQLTTGTGDIHLTFDAPSPGSPFGKTGGVLATGEYPPGGRIRFDAVETWAATGGPGVIDLQAVAVHEIGHALGLSHSDVPGATMYPKVSPSTVVDAESSAALRSLYGWQAPQRLPDRATTDRPALGLVTTTTLSGRNDSIYMVWTGGPGDTGVYASQLDPVARVWSPQVLLPGMNTSHGPALSSVSISVPAGGQLIDGMIMAWKGGGDDPALYWNRYDGSAWGRSIRIDGVGTSAGPALVRVAGKVYMAWKGMGRDTGLYWSSFDGVSSWSPQRPVRGAGTAGTPALAAVGQRLHMFWRGTRSDEGIWTSVLDLGVGDIWEPQRRVVFAEYEADGGVAVPIGTSGGLSAVTDGTRVMLLWKGIDGDPAVWFTYLDGAKVSGQVSVPGAQTSAGPGALQVGGATYVAWKGAGRDTSISWTSL